jgi:hypothetical protein
MTPELGSTWSEPVVVVDLGEGGVGVGVVVDAVEDDADAFAVAFVDEGFEVFGATVGVFGGEQILGGVAPGVVAGVFLDGEEFEAVDAEVDEVVELVDDVAEFAALPDVGFAAGEVGDVEFVDDEFVVGGKRFVIVFPLVFVGADLAVANAEDAIAGFVIDAGGFGIGDGDPLIFFVEPGFGLDAEAVGVVAVGEFDIDAPEALNVFGHGDFLPARETADEDDAFDGGGEEGDFDGGGRQDGGEGGGLDGIGAGHA